MSHSLIPSDLTVAGERPRAVAVDAGLAVDGAVGCLAEDRLVCPARQAMDVSVGIAKVRFVRLKWYLF